MTNPVDPNVIARLITENPDVPPEQDGQAMAMTSQNTYKARISFGTPELFNTRYVGTGQKTARGAVQAAFKQIRYKVEIFEVRGDIESILFTIYAKNEEEAKNRASSMMARLKRRYK